MVPFSENGIPAYELKGQLETHVGCDTINDEMAQRASAA